MNIEELATSPAVFSPCREYRYSLRREIGGPGRLALFIMLNPSTADEQRDDPTIRRCIGFATRWGASVLYIANLFALRATDPRVMCRHPEPVGPGNDTAIFLLATLCAENNGTIVCAWGARGAHMARGHNLTQRLRQSFGLWHLGLTKHGEPRHPLYLSADTHLERMG